MKAGLATSVVLHAALLGYGLLTLSAPRAFEVADVEAFPVDLVPVEAITQVQKGDKKAPVSEKPAPLPTKRPDIVADAKTVGDNSVDTDKAPTPDPKPLPVEAASVPEPSPKPAPPKPVKEAEAPKPPEPKPEPAPEPAPKPDVSPDPVTAAIAASEDATEALKLPDQAPSPEAKPKPEKPQPEKTAEKTPDRKPDQKPAEKPTKEAAAKPKSQEKSFDADEVAALLNKQKPSGGGAKRSTQMASLGGDKPTGAKLSQGEMDALSSQLAGCWSIPAGAADGDSLRVSVAFNVDASGRVEGRPEIKASSGNRSFDESAVRAVQKCDRDGLALPKDKADIWAQVVVNFDPAEMF